MIPLFSSKKTASGIVHTGHCWFGGLLLGMDGVNDVTVTVYDGIDNSGTEIVPTNTYDSSSLGINGAQEGTLVVCSTGIYVEITGANAEVCVRYRPR